MRIYKCIGLIGLILLWMTGITLASIPKNVKITNVDAYQFTISWITDVDEIGYIIWGTNTNSLNNIGLDDRDKDEGTPTTKDDTHHVTVKGSPVSPLTTYYYKIISGTQVINIGSLTTGAEISRDPGDSVYGHVYHKYSLLPATGTIIYLNLSKGTSNISATRSVLVVSEGFWVEYLGNFRTLDLSAFFDYSDDNLCIYVEGASSGTATLTLKINEANPAPDIIIPPDTTPPGTPTVIDDGTYTNSSTQLHATWEAQDLESGIVEFMYAIGTSKGATDIVNWTSIGTKTEITKTGLNLHHGQVYYFGVKAKNRARLWSNVGYSDGIEVDIQALPNKLITPISNIYVKRNFKVCYVLGEDSSSGTLTFTRTGGIHTLSLNAENLTAGTHTVTVTLKLVNNATYSISLDSMDRWGNSAPKVTNTNIAYLNVDSYDELPIRMHQTNVTDTQFTISWITNTPVTGYIKYGTSTALGKEAHDTRIGYTHYVNITGLGSLTTYYYDIVSGEVPENLPGVHYTIITGKSITGGGNNDIAWGYVYKSDGVTPATDSIVYLRLEDKNGTETLGSSAEYSTLVDSQGRWNINLINFRTQSLDSLFKYSTISDTLCIYVDGGQVGIKSLKIDTGNDSPAPKIIIGHTPHLPPKVPVYPNPFVPSKGHKFITFGGLNEYRLTKEVTIKIFTIAGELVHKIKRSDCNGQIEWTPTDNLASGIYIYLITNPAGEWARGKLGIIK